MRKSWPDFTFERKLYKKGFDVIGGVDEVGRGCFAGPIVAGCVVLQKNFFLPKNIRIDDSKRMTKLQRERGEVWIKEN